MTGRWWEEPLACLDTETTGTDVQRDRILEIALVEVGPDGQVLNRLCRLCRVDVPIPADAAAIHGITAERLRREGVEPAQVFGEVLGRLESYHGADRPLVIFNAPFDWPLLHWEVMRHGLEMPPALNLLDPLCMDRFLDRYRGGGRQLQTVAAHYGVPLQGTHSAAADAIAAVGILRALAARYPVLREHTPRELFTLQIDWHAAWRDSLNEYLARKGRRDLITGSWPGLLPVTTRSDKPAAASSS